jgi:hypothetical protein
MIVELLYNHITQFNEGRMLKFSPRLCKSALRDFLNVKLARPKELVIMIEFFLDRAGNDIHQKNN